MLPKTAVCRNFIFPLQTASVACFQSKIQLSGWLVFLINPGKNGVLLYPGFLPRLVLYL